MTTLRARFDGKVLVPEGPVNLPTDRILEIDVRDEGLQPGSSEALKHFMKTNSPVPAEDLKAMLNAIEEANQPADYRDVFDDDASTTGGQ